MASVGLAGFAQGLASSPLGNLPELMLTKQRLDVEKEKFQLWKADREDERAREGDRKMRLLEADVIGQREGLGAAVDHLMKSGLTEDATRLSNINQNRGLASHRERTLDHTIADSDRRFDLAEDEMGLAERRQGYAELSGDREYGLAERAQEYTELAGDRRHEMGLAGLALDERRQDYTELSGDRRYDLARDELGLAERGQDYVETSGDRKLDLAEREQSYTELAGDREYGLAEREQEYTELAGDRSHQLELRDSDRKDIDLMNRWDLSKGEEGRARAQFERGEIELARQTVGRAWNTMGWTASDYGTPEFEGYVEELFRGNSKMFADMMGISKDRIPVGAEFVVNEDGSYEVAPKIWNKKVDSVGPMTHGGTADKGDRVYSMPVEQFDAVMRQMGTVPEEVEPKKWTLKGDLKIEEGSGETVPVSGESMEEYQRTKDFNFVTDAAKKYSSTKDFLPQGEIFYNKFVASNAKSLLEAGVPKEGMAGQIGVLMKTPEIKSLIDEGTPESLGLANLKMLELMMPKKQGNVEQMNISTIPVDPRATMPRASGPKPGPTYGGKGLSFIAESWNN